MEGDLSILSTMSLILSFQSTPSAWRETPVNKIVHLICNYFNPLPPHGGRLITCRNFTSNSKFQSTPSAWRETSCWQAFKADSKPFQSTPSAWRETCKVYCNNSTNVFQSTPSAWRETYNGGERLSTFFIFQSTPSAWRETHYPPTYTYMILHFNPLPPHGGRLCEPIPNCHIYIFQSTPSAWRETL